MAYSDPRPAFDPFKERPGADEHTEPRSLASEESEHGDALRSARAQGQSDEGARQARADEIYASSESPDLDVLCKAHPDLAVEFALIERERRDAEGASAGLPSGIDGISFFGRQQDGEHQAYAGVSAGQILGDFRLVRLVGQGGMGQVWEAEQVSLGRRVALKLVRPDRITPRTLALFAREARAGGRTNHRGIVSVYAHGEDASLAWIAMEFVGGAWSLRDFLDAIAKSDDLPVTYYRDVAVLTAKLAEALSAAHSAGVIHRDLKPQNVLITRDNEPKVTDFGLARIIDESALSEAGDVAGTYYYMSPEQVRGHRAEVDHRSDVFSLGVMLYEMLALRRPFEGDTTHQIAEQILRQDPPDLRGIRSRVPGDLAVIAGKCLEKSSSRRYATMAELAADLRRYVNSEPIHARPPGKLHKAILWSQRNRAESMVAAVVTIALGVVSVLLVDNVRANDDLDISNQDLSRTVTQRDDAIGSLEDANATLEGQQEELAGLNLELLSEKENLQTAVEDLAEQTRIATEVADFQSMRLSRVDPAAMGRGIRASLFEALRESGERSQLPAEILDRTAATLENVLSGANFTDIALSALDENIFEEALKALGEFDDEPLVKAQLLQSLARTLHALDLMDRAAGPQQESLEIRRRVLGPEHPLTLESVTLTGLLMHDQGRLDEAEEHYWIALEASERILGEEHPKTLGALNNIAGVLISKGRLEEAEEFSRDALAISIRVHGEGHPATLPALNTMGMLLQDQGKLTEAEQYLRQVMEARIRLLGDGDVMALSAINNYALLLNDLGRASEAQEYCKRVLKGYRNVLGEDHSRTLGALNSLGALLLSAGNTAEGTLYLRKALEGRGRTLGEDHPDTLRSLNNLGFGLKAQGKLQEAEELLERAVESRTRVLGEDHPETLSSRNNLGTVRHAQGRLDEAEILFVEVLEARRRILGTDHPRTLTSINNLGSVLKLQGRLEEAEVLQREALSISRSTLGEEHPSTLTYLNGIGTLLRAKGDPKGAEKYFRKSLEGRRRVLGDDHPRTLTVISNLVYLLYSESRYAEALELASELVERTPEVDGEYRERLELLEELETMVEEQTSGSSNGDQ